MRVSPSFFSRSRALPFPCSPDPDPLPTAPAALELVSDAAEGAVSRPSRSSSQSPGKNLGASGQRRVPTSRRGGGAASKRGSRERWGCLPGAGRPWRGRGARSRVGTRDSFTNNAGSLEGGRVGWGDTKNGGAFEAKVTVWPPAASVPRSLRSCAPCARGSPRTWPPLGPSSAADASWARPPGPPLGPGRPRSRSRAWAATCATPARSGSRTHWWRLGGGGGEAAGQRRPGTSEKRHPQKRWFRAPCRLARAHWGRRRESETWSGRAAGPAASCHRSSAGRAPPQCLIWAFQQSPVVNSSSRQSPPTRAHTHAGALSPPLSSRACALLGPATSPREVATTARGGRRQGLSFPPAAPSRSKPPPGHARSEAGGRPEGPAPTGASLRVQGKGSPQRKGLCGWEGRNASRIGVGGGRRGMRREGRGPWDEEKGAGDAPWPPASVAQPAAPTPADASIELALQPRAGHQEVI